MNKQADKIQTNFSDELFNKLIEKVKSYPTGIVPVPKNRINGTAFFPGGDGLYEHKNFATTIGGVMILGQDFDNESNFEVSKEFGSEIKKNKKNPTWSNIEKILSINEVSIEHCFFTNAIMGLRKGNTKNEGRSRAFLNNNSLFLEECRSFFKEQVKAQRPKLIIGLGRFIPFFLASTSNSLKDLSKITSLNQLGDNISENIFNVSYDSFNTRVIFITHPARYLLCAPNRLGKSRKEDGIKFENELLKMANKY